MRRNRRMNERKRNLNESKMLRLAQDLVSDGVIRNAEDFFNAMQYRGQVMVRIENDSETIDMVRSGDVSYEMDGEFLVVNMDGRYAYSIHNHEIENVEVRGNSVKLYTDKLTFSFNAK